MLKATHRPTVSVVVPAWNEEKFIDQSLRTVASQSFTNFEVIVVNDGSTDSTGSIIDRFCESDHRFSRLDMEKNSGTGAALNKGFNKARGRYQTWVSADSWVEEDFLKELVDALENNPDKVMAYSDWYIVNEQGETVQTVKVGDYERKRLQTTCYIGPCWLFREAAL